MPYTEVPFLPAGTVPYSHQVAGHKKSKISGTALLKHPHKPIVYKYLQDSCRGDREVEFYKCAFDVNAPEHFRSMRPFIANYFGVFRCPASQELYMGLSDLLNTFECPSVCDIKLGSITYAFDSPLAERLREERKYQWRKQLGFLISGMQVYDEQEGNLVMATKEYCRSLDPEQVYTRALLPFLGTDPGRRVQLAQRFLVKLTNLKYWFEKTVAPSLTFCRTSLLIMHESSPSRSREHAEMKLIDFAHWYELGGKRDDFVKRNSYAELTRGFLSGLCTLINMMHRVLTSPTCDDATEELIQHPSALFSSQPD
ncbi:unnamed protein product [Calicophoron daubneyi]|uniref:Kinase n=1 Tax=Calicophoron daubneyi TaxID=300641 RepID=A0AAV2TEI3_CALDB